MQHPDRGHVRGLQTLHQDLDQDLNLLQFPRSLPNLVLGLQEVENLPVLDQDPDQLVLDQGQGPNQGQGPDLEVRKAQDYQGRAQIQGRNHVLVQDQDPYIAKGPGDRVAPDHLPVPEVDQDQIVVSSFIDMNLTTLKRKVVIIIFQV